MFELKFYCQFTGSMYKMVNTIEQYILTFFCLFHKRVYIKYVAKSQSLKYLCCVLKCISLAALFIELHCLLH